MEGTKIKVLILNTWDLEGGAAIAAYRLHQNFLSHEIDSKMLVQRKSSSDPTVIELSRFQRLLMPILDKIPVRRYKNKSLFSPAWLYNPCVLSKIKELNPDVINLHWICDGFLSIKNIEKIGKLGIPIVWTLHDMWAFTGGEHYDENQNHWLGTCGNSKVLQSNKFKDLSYKVWQKKNKLWKDLDLTIVTPSTWLGNCAKKSSLFFNRTVKVIPNCISGFKKIDRMVARDILGLSKDKKLILFGAMDPLSNRRKGYIELIEALRLLPEKEDIELVVFGATGHKIDIDFPVHYLGSFKDDISLRVVYSAADILVQSALQENLSNVILESLMCDTPVVAFDIGGNSDMVKHKQNGYLAQEGNIEDLSNGITWALSGFEFINELDQFSNEEVYKKYINLFSGLT